MPTTVTFAPSRHLCRQLRAARDERDWNRAELAARAGLSDHTLIYRMEIGRMKCWDVQTLAMLCVALEAPEVWALAVREITAALHQEVA